MDVTALGELLIDFTENGISEQGNRTFEANPGGAPCNVLAMLTKLGNKTAFIGKVGNDSFGMELKNRVSQLGIHTESLYFDSNVNTTLAFVSKLPDGDRDFSFYRSPGADMMLSPDEILEKDFVNTKIFHFGTLSMTHEGVEQATRKALQFAKANHCLISFDPNIREPLWSSLEHARKATLFGLEFTDILKISDNELQWLTETTDYEEGVRWILERYPMKLLVLSCGKDGSIAYYDGFRIEEPAFLSEKTIETTGAGDTFGGCILHFVLQYGLENLNENRLREMLQFANAAASIVTERKGALCVMPDESEIKKRMKR